MGKIYACIDLKSFYASVECHERGLDPLKTNLVVADETRTDGTICLAVSPSLKAEGVGARPRLFQVKEKVREINLRRLGQRKKFSGKSYFADELAKNPTLALDFLIAPPRMRRYMEYSAQIYNTYLDFLAAEDILVYSIDEVFMDLTKYLELYQLSAEELVAKMIEMVNEKTGITATAGIGTNMYLAKVAMDVEAKKMEPNALGVRMASLDEKSYREKLWTHQPLTDFWRIGLGYVRKLREHGMRTMGDVARVSLDNEELLFRLFGVNAEFLIDHAWGVETCSLEQARNYKPAIHSISRGQVLHGFYDCRRARVIVKEMVDELTLKMVEKRVVSSQFVLYISYTDERGERGRGREQRRHARGTVNFSHRTSSMQTVLQGVVEMYDKLVRPEWRVRKIGLTANDIVDEGLVREAMPTVQLDLFGEYLRRAEAETQTLKREERERHVQQAILAIKRRYGKNAILRAVDFEEGATARERNLEVGGHKG